MVRKAALKKTSSFLPRGFGRSVDFAAQDAVAEADAAHIELAQIRMGTPAQRATIVFPHAEFGLALGLCNL